MTSCEDRVIKQLFAKGPFLGYRLMFAVVLGACLMVAEHRFSEVATARSWITLIVTPLQWAADAPGRVWGWSSDSLANRNLLLEENRELKSQALILAERSQIMAAVAAENVRLRELLNASHRSEIRFITGELIGVNYDPFSQQVIINRGRQDDAYIGQPVVDAAGIMGQLVSVTPYTSRLLLISDINHAIPVQVNRNGLRFIAQGTGRADELRLSHVPETADLREGDLLITSGLGGRFPFGYPVAVIEEISHQRGEPFMDVVAKPLAQLDRSRYVLLLFHQLSGSDPELLEKAQPRRSTDG
ncbi:MAG: rod shape-determining protein MreC [Marinospirillum sp.]|uniref:rod shape-determining protein MreC n=1 Tax=Marinospirillum sp. TaxID=2183934 RepID=UPI0019FC8F7E|nr:rod shape-determining protein MreC [Marinospirillum sp.]MBE0507407.1 rod shape-determining protein MreC [Marinospirillum sp.]